jgi:ATP-dependent protease ClpP protease subunit
MVDIFFYSRFSDSSSEWLAAQIRDNFGEDINIRLNTPGGSVSGGSGVLSAISDNPGNTTIYVDGSAISMGAILLPFANTVVATNFSRIMAHLASYPSWYEPTEDEQKTLDNMNGEIVKAFQKVVPKTPEGKEFIKRLKDGDDIELTAKEAKELNLVDKINILTPSAQADLDASIDLRELECKQSIVAYKEDTNTSKKHIKKDKIMAKEVMTVAEIKTTQPEIYEDIVKIGAEEEAAKLKKKHDAEIVAERERITGLLKYRNLLPETIDAAIAAGDSASDLMECLMEAQAKKAQAVAMTKDNEGTPNVDVTTEEIDGENKPEIHISAFNAEFSHLSAEDKTEKRKEYTIIEK